MKTGLPRLVGLLATLILAPASVLAGPGPAESQTSANPAQAVAGMVQCLPMNFTVPLFIPTHPRVATTLRFPGPIGAPEGRGFTEDETKSPGEYLVSWTPGDAHLTITPLPGAGPLNLNIPFEGDTVVAYFYPVEKQLAAVTCIKLLPRKQGDSRILPDITRNTGQGPLKATEPHRPMKSLPPEPAQLSGLLDKLQLLSACQSPEDLGRMAAKLHLQVAVSPPKAAAAATETPGRPERDGLRLETRLLIRQEELNTLGLLLRLTNTGREPVALDVASFSLRAGGLLLTQSLSDAAPILMPGEEKEARVLFTCPPEHPLRLENDWQPSVDQLPREGAAKLFHVETSPSSP